MLRSKATAALMKLKEIDRKYKIKPSEDVKLQSSLSDISTMDNTDEISKHLATSGDKRDAIISTRTKLDIRMPEAHMERTGSQENEAKLVTIFNKAKKHSPESNSNTSPGIITSVKEPEESNLDLQAGEENISEMLTSFKNPSPIISEEQVANSETSISEDVPEVVSSSHPVSDHLVADVSPEMTLKSVDSIIDAEERAQSELDEDPSALVASGTYSDDFVKTFSSGNAKDSNISPEKNVTVNKAAALEPELTSPQVEYVTSQRSPELDKSTEPETEDIEELVSVEVLRVHANFDADLTNHVKKIDRDVSEEAEDPVSLLEQRSIESSSARSSKEFRRRRRPHASSSSRDSKSSEFLTTSRQKEKIEPSNISGTLNATKGNLQSGENSRKTNRSGKEKILKDSQTLFIQETRKDRREADANGISWSSKDEVVAAMRREKAVPKMKTLKSAKSGTRAKDSSAKEPPPNYSNDSQGHKYTSVIQPVPATMVRPEPKVLQFSRDDEVAHEPQRASKYRAVSHGQKRRSNKPKPADSLRSKHRTKEGRLGRYKNQTREEPGLGYEGRDVDRLRQQIKELRVQQDRDRLRARVRGYVQQMMSEQRRLLAHGGGFGGSIDQFDYSTTGLRRTESLRSFFKPLDLPNVAGFKRPDFEDDQSADVENDRNLHLHMIRERVLGIRHWLKQQFVLYRDYSSLASTINAKYIPATLKETKKMIHDMQRFYNNRERRRHVR